MALSVARTLEMTELGPVSAHLEAELRELARQHGIVVWLDKQATYREFAEGLRARAEEGAFPFPVRSFRGSFLELMVELDGLEEGVGMTPLVVYLPWHNKEDVKKTPLLELFRAGRSHERALPTLVNEAAHGRATVPDLQAFLASGGLTLEKADAWLESLSKSQSKNGPDLSALEADHLFDQLMPGRPLAEQLGQAEMERAIWQRAEVLLGITPELRRRIEPSGAVSVAERASNLALALASCALYVEFVNDLKRPPKDAWLAPLAKLPKKNVEACRQLCAHMRERYADRYPALADESEARLSNETHDISAEDLGQVDTFQFEDRKIMAAALDALHRRDYRAAHDWAMARLESFWGKHKPERKRAWQLVHLAATLGLALGAEAKLLERAKSLSDAVERYSARGFRVDAAHRKLEQARQQAAVLEIDEFPVLRERLEGMRGAYREWADVQARAFNGLCMNQGFLPPPALRQRELFEEVVRPLTQADGVTAYFTVDALRFELGQELYDALMQTGTGEVTLKARLAELPTVTEVGMNVLAPLSVGGRLRPDLDEQRILGFRTHEARVASPQQRQKVMHERAGGATCPLLDLDEVLNRDVTSLRRAIAGARLVFVHADGIDKAGEKGMGLSTFEQELRNLRAAWRQLYDAGVRRFVFTADHGFLLHDAGTRDPVPHGPKTLPKRRHVVSRDYLDREGRVAVRASELEYDCDDVSFLFPETAAPFDIGEKAKNFVHGGNSLQERVIPVLVVQHAHPAGAETVRYRLEAEVGKPLARMHCLKAAVRVEAGHTLSFSSSKEMELSLEVVDAPDVKLELCDARGAEVRESYVLAAVEEPFELYFRVRGASSERVRVRLRHAVQVAVVEPLELAARFDVEAQLGSTRPPPPAEKKRSALPPADAWLLALPEGGVREVFRHLMVHGTINETEATRLLGSPREFRKFSREVDVHAAVAPFRVRADMSSGIKCYVRVEG
jgi:hypothetical protein